MRVNSVQNSQNFGMALKLKGDGAMALAKKFHGFSDPIVAEDSFVKNFVKPLERIKSELIYDGKDVFVRDHQTTDMYKVMDGIPVVNNTQVFYPVRNKANNDLLFGVEYFKKENLPKIDAQTLSETETKLSYAKEILKEMARKESSVETVEQTAERLNKIYD